ncbi:MAG: FecR domain-containing protein [Odoribacter sp.]|nr:FecR domain-containing protein [Odoribacter sp.]
MRKFDEYSEIVELLVRSLQENISADEQMLIDVWRKEDPMNEAIYQKILSPEYWDKHPQQKYQGDIVKAWVRLYERRQKQEYRWRLQRRLRAVAAVVVLVIGCSALWQVFYWQKNDSGDRSLVAQRSGDMNKVELVLSNGSTVFLGESDNLGDVNEEGAVIQAKKDAVHYVDNEGNNEVKYNTLRVPRGAEYELVLADGTSVWLNAESEITYPVTFKGDMREVTLKGEAFFDVAKDAAHPFIVHIKDFDVRVTGTKFNVRNYADMPSSATLAEGEVQLEKEGEVTILQPGQQAALIDGKIEVKEVDLEEAIAWRYNSFCFKHQSLELLLNELARWYNLEIFYMNPSLKTLHFTAWFSRGNSVAEVIEKLERTQKIRLELKGNTLIVKSNN